MRGIDTQTRWSFRLGVAALLVLVHLGIWRPVRDVLIEHAAFPLVEAISTPRAQQIALGLEPRTVVADSGGRVDRFYAPAGLAYLITAFMLVLAFPRRLYWLWLWLALLILGMLTFGAFVLGVGWTDAGFAVNDLGYLYLAPAFCLLALVTPLLPDGIAAIERASESGKASPND